MRLVVLLAMIAACYGSSRRDDQPRHPLVLDPNAPLPVAGKCTWPGRVAPAGAVPAELAPQLEHGLETIELRGDLRFTSPTAFGSSHPATGWSRDGNWLAIADSSGVFVWEAATGALRSVVPLVPRQYVYAVALSSDGEQVAFVASTSSKSASLFIASVAEPRRVRQFDAPASEQLRFSSDETRLMAGGTVWDLSSGTRTAVKATSYNGQALPDGVHIVDLPLSNSNDAVEFREASTGRVLHRFSVDAAFWWSASGDGTHLAIAGKAGIDVHALDTGRRVRRFAELTFPAPAGCEQTFLLSPDGSRLLFSRTGYGESREGAPIWPTTEMWDVKTGRRVWKGNIGNLGFWRFSSDGKYLVAAFGMSGIVYRAEDGKYVNLGHSFVDLSPDSRWQQVEPAYGSSVPNWLEVAPVDPDHGDLGIARAGPVIARSRDGKYIASMGADGQLQLESENACIGLGVVIREDDKATFSADGGALLVATRGGGRAYAWRTSDGAAVRAVSWTGSIVELLADTGRVLFGQDQRQRAIPVRRVFDMLAGQEVHVPALTEPVLDPLSFQRQTVATRDGRQLYVAGTPALEVVDLDDQARSAVLHPKASIVAISADDRLVAAASGARVDIWTRIDWHSQIDVTHGRRVTRLAFSADGAQLASADEGGLVNVTRTSDGKRLARLRLPHDRVLYLWFSADGTELEVDTARGLRARLRLVPP